MNLRRVRLHGRDELLVRASTDDLSTVARYLLLGANHLILSA